MSKGAEHAGLGRVRGAEHAGLGRVRGCRVLRGGWPG